MMINRITAANSNYFHYSNLNTPKIAKSKNINSASSKHILQITFCGNDKNPNQIAVIAAECVPYCVAGGLGDVTRDMTKAYKEKYPNKDIRIFLPFYNKKSNDFYYATQNNKNHSSNIYEIEDSNKLKSKIV